MIEPADVYAPELHVLRLPTASLRVAYAGDGPPLLLVNGIGASIEMWRPLAAQLARSHRLIMFDAPGAGASPVPRRPLLMPALARTVRELLDHSGVDEADVLGYSWGGALAQQLAHDAPRRVRRLVLVSTTPGLGGQLPSPLVMALMVSPLRYFSSGFLARAAPHIYGGTRGDPAARGRPGLRSWLENPPSVRGYAYQTAAIASWGNLSWRRRIQAPTLILQGDDDPLVPVRNARVLAHRLPNSTVRIIPGGGHLWALDQADEAAAAVSGFLDETGSGQAERSRT